MASRSHDRRNLAFHATKALAVLHTHGFCHADFRPANILLKASSEGRITPPSDPDDDAVALLKVVDFGQSFRMSENKRPATSNHGVPANYAPPEIFLAKEDFFRMHPPTYMDLWSLACTIFEVRLGHPLFDMTIFNDGLESVDYLTPVLPLLGGPKELVSQPGWGRLFSREKRRERLEERVQQVTEGTKKAPMPKAEAAALADLLERLLRWDPKDRLSAQEALKHRWFRQV